MSKITQAYVDGQIRWVKLDREIIDLDPAEVNINEAKLSKRLEVEQAKDRDVIGVVDTKRLLLLLRNNNTFSGVVWETRMQLSGGYAYL